MLKKIALALAFAASGSALAAMPVGQKPALLTLKGDDGSKVDGSAWSSEMIKDKVWALFYVDPDRRNANEELEKALKDQNFPKDKYGSLGIINMAATWLPNAAIASSLEAKQEEYPDTVYVKDLKKVLVNQWKLADDEYDVVVFDKAGKVLYVKDGEFTKADIAAMIDVIKKNLDAAKP